MAKRKKEGEIKKTGTPLSIFLPHLLLCSKQIVEEKAKYLADLLRSNETEEPWVEIGKRKTKIVHGKISPKKIVRSILSHMPSAELENCLLHLKKYLANSKMQILSLFPSALSSTLHSSPLQKKQKK